MERVFVDTAAWIALLHERDQMRARALLVLGDLQRQRIPLLTTDFVLIELADALSSPQLRSKTVAFIDGLRRNSLLVILPLSNELLTKGWNLYSQRPDKEWGLTDCISFVAMNDYEVRRALTSDHHFSQAGFEKLL